MMTGTARIGVILVGVTLNVAVALAQVPSPFHVIPIGGKVKGAADTDWITDLTVSNVSDTDGMVGIAFFPAGQANSFDGTFPFESAIASRNTLLWRDVVGTLFPELGSAVQGLLLVADTTPPQCSLPEPPVMSLAVTSRTYNNADPSKTYGQTVPASLLFANFTAYPTIITGVRHQPGLVPGFRSNVGVANISTVAIEVTVDVFRGDGSVAGSGQRTVEPLSVRQWSLSDFGVTSLESGGVVVSMDSSAITIDLCSLRSLQDFPICLRPCDPGCNGEYAFPSTGTFIAYVSKVDNGSGDAEFLLPATDWFSFVGDCGYGKKGSRLRRLIGGAGGK